MEKLWISAPTFLLLRATCDNYRLDGYPVDSLNSWHFFTLSLL